MAARTAPAPGRGAPTRRPPVPAGTSETTRDRGHDGAGAPPRRFRRGVAALLVVLPGADLGCRVVVPAFQRHPVSHDARIFREELRPRVSGHRRRSLPDDVKLAVAADLADVDR